jgi:hypothetical protein
VVNLNILENDEKFEENQTADLVLMALCFVAFALAGYLLANYLGF